MEELKPCPFCGGEAEVIQVNCIMPDGQVGYFVGCKNQYCRGSGTLFSTPYYSPEFAIDAWNRRADDGKKKRIDALTEVEAKAALG